MSPSQTIRTRSLKNNFGIEILGVDLATADDETKKEVAALIRGNSVGLLRDQRITPADHVSFTRFFGQPAENLLSDYTLPGQPEVFIITNKVVNGKPGVYSVGDVWHTDMAHVENAGDVTLLYALEVPKVGADTELTDCVSAYEELPEDLKTDLKGKEILHSYAQHAANRGYKLSPEKLQSVPDVYHPIVRQLPDGRKTLFICSGTPKSVSGMANPGGLDLINRLMEFATQDRFVYRHKWKVGDFLVWDNACTLHQGTPFDVHNDVRLMHRVWVQGTRPLMAQ